MPWASWLSHVFGHRHPHRSAISSSSAPNPVSHEHVPRCNRRWLQGFDPVPLLRETKIKLGSWSQTVPAQLLQTFVKWNRGCKILSPSLSYSPFHPQPSSSHVDSSSGTCSRHLSCAGHGLTPALDKSEVVSN